MDYRWTLDGLEGTIQRAGNYSTSIDRAIRTIATFDYVGATPDPKRVYTLRLTDPQRTWVSPSLVSAIRGIDRSPLTFSSLEMLLERQVLTAPLTVLQGQDLLTAVANQIGSTTFPLTWLGPVSGAAASVTLQFERGTTILEVVNTLLSAAGFNSCYGVTNGIMADRRVDPTTITPIQIASNRIIEIIEDQSDVDYTNRVTALGIGDGVNVGQFATVRDQASIAELGRTLDRVIRVQSNVMQVLIDAAWNELRTSSRISRVDLVVSGGHWAIGQRLQFTDPKTGKFYDVHIRAMEIDFNDPVWRLRCHRTRSVMLRSNTTIETSEQLPIVGSAVVGEAML